VHRVLQAFHPSPIRRQPHDIGKRNLELDHRSTSLPGVGERAFGNIHSVWGAWLYAGDPHSTRAGLPRITNKAEAIFEAWGATKEQTEANIIQCFLFLSAAQDEALVSELGAVTA
jgi:hypothetical protein